MLHTAVVFGPTIQWRQKASPRFAVEGTHCRSAAHRARVCTGFASNSLTEAEPALCPHCSTLSSLVCSGHVPPLLRTDTTNTHHAPARPGAVGKRGPRDAHPQSEASQSSSIWHGISHALPAIPCVECSAVTVVTTARRSDVMSRRLAVWYA